LVILFMSPSLTTAFLAQANRELATSLLYRALAYWADYRDYNGFKQLFETQAEEEETHAKNFYAYLTERDQPVAIGPIEAIAPAYADLLSVSKAVHAHERANTRAIHALYELALSEKDYACQVFLQTYIAEQVEEEAWTDSLVERVSRSACAGALYNLDRHIVKDLFGDK
jgi:ferritin